MSNDIRVYEPDTDWFSEARELTVGAVMGSPRVDLTEDDPDERLGHGRSVQLTLAAGDNTQFTILTEAQALDLISTFARRIGCADNYSATDWLEELRVHPDGSKEVIER